MTIEVLPIGGFLEVGRNMTAVRIDGEIIILDMGFFLPSLVSFEEEGGDRRTLNREGLIKIGAIPDDNKLVQFKDQVKAIVIGHCHLDHVGATPWLATNYPQAPIIGTPFTMEVLKNQIGEDKIKLKNPIKAVSPNSKIQVTQNITIELIHVNHSTLQTAIVAIHTDDGTILYANDYKFDQTPVVGKKVNMKRLKELGGENVKCLISNCLYSNTEGKCPSEKVAREMLKEVMLGTENQSNVILSTTFASHIPRLRSLYDFGQKLDREVVFLGRSMMKYIKAAENLNLVELPHARIVPYGNQVKRELKKIEQNRSKYLVVCTGGQGEPNAVLTRIATGQHHFKFQKEDHIVFSNKTIPVPINLQNRAELESNLKQKGVRIFKDIHVSGHGAREDIRDLITMTKPEFIIPTHGYPKMYAGIKELAPDLGYEEGKGLRMVKNGQILKL